LGNEGSLNLTTKQRDVRESERSLNRDDRGSERWLNRTIKIGDRGSERWLNRTIKNGDRGSEWSLTLTITTQKNDATTYAEVVHVETVNLTKFSKY
jgi:hypothetical protein